jgi:hypothetical protein
MRGRGIHPSMGQHVARKHVTVGIGTLCLGMVRVE